jgi:putative ABC transport system permease protein
MLVVAAATLVRNGISIGATNLGFDTAGIMSVKTRLPANGLIARAADQLALSPAIDAIAAASRNPLSEQLSKVPIVPAPGAEVIATSYRFVSPEYFAILHVPLLHGRLFSKSEAASEAHVTILSAAAARAFWPGESPLGRTLRLEIDRIDQQRADTTAVDRHAGDTTPADTFDVVVVGVVGDVISGLMADGVDPAHLYLPTSAHGAHAAELMLRPRPGADLRPDRVRTTLARVHPDPLMFEVLPLDELREAQMFPLWAASWVGSLLGIIALALSVSGLYGVLTYTLGQRTREIGIRMALGATAAAVVGLVMRQSARVAAVGAAIGLVIVFAVLRVLSSVIPLRNVVVLDIGAFLAGLLLVALATAAATFAPARRAARVDPR